MAWGPLRLIGMGALGAPPPCIPEKPVECMAQVRGCDATGADVSRGFRELQHGDDVVRILGLGFCPVDWVHRTDRAAGTISDWAGLGEPTHVSGGGAVGNSLCLLSVLGHSCVFVGNCGDDDGAAVLEADFRRFGVEPRLVRKAGKRTPRARILVRSDGSHRFIPDWRSAPANLSAGDLAVALAGHERFDLLLIESAGASARAACGRADRIVFNGQSARVDDRRRAAIADLVPRLSLLVACGELVRALAGKGEADAVEAADLAFGPRLTVATLGSAGLLARLGDAVIRQAVPSSVTVVDTCGAGDAFLGALIHRLAPAFAPTVGQFEAACRAAQRVAGLACSRLGARGYLNNPAAVGECLRN